MNPKLTRRRFIKGVIASGAAATSTTIWYSANGQSRPAGAVERMIRININGQMRNVDVAPQETLASTLRYKLGLTGTKLGCNRGECGACTVLVDDVPSYACSVLTHSVKNMRVESVEGLEAANGDLHPVQQAFVDELSPQSVYCDLTLIQQEKKHDKLCQAISAVVVLMILTLTASCAQHK